MNKISLNAQILSGTLAGILLGLGLAMLDQESTVKQNSLYVAGLVGTLFIDLLRMVLIPLVFTSIVVGVANLRSHQTNESGMARYAWLFHIDDGAGVDTRAC